MIAVFVIGCALLIVAGVFIGIVVMLSDDAQDWRHRG